MRRSSRRLLLVTMVAGAVWAIRGLLLLRSDRRARGPLPGPWPPLPDPDRAAATPSPASAQPAPPPAPAAAPPTTLPSTATSTPPTTGTPPTTSTPPTTTAPAASTAPGTTLAPEATPAPAADTLVPAGQTWLEPSDGGGCPVTHPVKAKVRSRLYHLPGMAAYDRTHPDRCYRTADEAEAEGFARAKR